MGGIISDLTGFTDVIHGGDIAAGNRECDDADDDVGIQSGWKLGPLLAVCASRRGRRGEEMLRGMGSGHGGSAWTYSLVAAGGGW